MYLLQKCCCNCSFCHVEYQMYGKAWSKYGKILKIKRFVFRKKKAHFLYIFSNPFKPPDFHISLCVWGDSSWRAGWRKLMKQAGGPALTLPPRLLSAQRSQAQTAFLLLSKSSVAALQRKQIPTCTYHLEKYHEAKIYIILHIYLNNVYITFLNPFLLLLWPEFPAGFTV